MNTRLKQILHALSPDPDLAEILFQNKNQAYGAYILRRDFPRVLVISMFVVISLSTVFLGTLLIISLLRQPKDVPPPPKVVQVSQLSEPPSIVESRTARPETVVTRKVFVAPKVKKDSEVKKETEFRPPETASNPPVNQGEKLELKDDGRKSQEPPKPLPPPIYFVVVDFMPEPLEDIQNKVIVPQAAKDAGVEGRVFVKAFIDENGMVNRTELVKGLGYGCDEAAQNAVRRTRFRPGKHKGALVKVQMTLQVTIRT